MSRVWGKCSMEGKHQPLQLLLLWGAWTAGEVPTHEDIGKPSTHHCLFSDLSAGQQLCPATDLAVWAVRGVTLAAPAWLWAVFVLRWDGGRGTAAAKMDLESVLPPDVWVQVGPCANTVSQLSVPCLHRSASCRVSLLQKTVLHVLCKLLSVPMLTFTSLVMGLQVFLQLSWLTTGTPGTSQVLKTPGICPILHPHSLPTHVSWIWQSHTAQVFP